VSRRALPFDLNIQIQRPTADHPDHDAVGRPASIYHGLVRQWVEA
jgi:predicted 2-oxoglutarate/Fe(II)-dependent dioxygenase YbiX